MRCLSIELYTTKAESKLLYKFYNINKLGVSNFEFLFLRHHSTKSCVCLFFVSLTELYRYIDHESFSNLVFLQTSWINTLILNWVMSMHMFKIWSVINSNWNEWPNWYNRVIRFCSTIHIISFHNTTTLRDLINLAIAAGMPNTRVHESWQCLYQPSS